MGTLKRMSGYLLFQSFCTNSFACSGEGAQELIKFHSDQSTILWGLSITMILFTFIIRRKRNSFKKVKLSPYLVFPLAIIHPWTWLTATSGDCGHLLFYGSIAFTVVILVLLLLSILDYKRLTRG